MQKRKHSLIEAITNTFVGFAVSFGIQIVIYPAMGIPVKFSQNLVITTVFTIASIIRGYIIRRFFNNFKNKTK